MIIVLINFLNGTNDIRACNDLDEICLDGVSSIRIIRDERIAHAA